MKKILVLGILISIIGALVLYYFSSRVSGEAMRHHEMNKTSLQISGEALRQNKKHLSEDEVAKLNDYHMDKVFHDLEWAKEIEISDKVKDIQKDLAKLNPCEFLNKYQSANQRDLFLAINGEATALDPLSIFYLNDLNYIQYDQYMNELIDTADTTRAFLLDIDLYSYIKDPYDYTFNPKTREYYFNKNLNDDYSESDDDEMYYKLQSYLEAKGTAFVDKTFSAVDAVIDDIDTDPIISSVLVFSLNVNNDKRYKESKNVIHHKAFEMIKVKQEAMKWKVKSKLQGFLEEDDTEVINIIPLSLRDRYLSKASNPAEVALAYELYNKQISSHFKNIIPLTKELKESNPQIFKKLQKYFDRYLKTVDKNKNADWITRELYDVLSIYSPSFHNKSYDDFVSDKKGAYDPIYGSGCDDRRYKDLCNKFCTN
tara:strand:- start:21534 stop:22814 length:1281 start_codon:yes stop_codon:yes gene_type:complete